jgi:hypothetical protein
VLYLAKKLKDYYDSDFARFLGNKIKEYYLEFDLLGFVGKIEANIDDKPFLAR